MKIAIVGMGVAGVSVLREWTKEKKNNPSIEITAFGDAETFGTGVPYQEDDENLLMNVNAEFTTIVPEKQDDFVEWLEISQGKENPRFQHFPRQLFGVYLTERMNIWLSESKTVVVKEKVETIRVLTNEKFRIRSSSFVGDFDVVHLCMGDFPYKDPFQLIDNSKFIIDPFPIEKKLASLPKGANVGVLGTGLSSIDVFRYTYYKRPDLNVSFYSRSGRFKSIGGKSKTIDYIYFTEDNIKEEKKKNNGFIPLEVYLNWFKKELYHQEIDVENNWMMAPFGSKDNIRKELHDSHEVGTIQAILLGMNPFLTELWTALNEKDKRKFLDDYYGIWGKLRSTFPDISGEILLSAWDNGKISVFSDLVDVKENKHSFEFILKNGEVHHSDYVINAFGTDKNVSFDTARIPLLTQLLNERILQTETFGGVQVHVPDLSAVSQKYGVLKNFKIHGTLISGIQFGNNSVDIISNSVKSSIQDIVKEEKI